MCRTRKSRDSKPPSPPANRRLPPFLKPLLKVGKLHLTNGSIRFTAADNETLRHWDTADLDLTLERLSPELSAVPFTVNGRITASAESPVKAEVPAQESSPAAHAETAPQTPAETPAPEETPQSAPQETPAPAAAPEAPASDAPAAAPEAPASGTPAADTPQEPAEPAETTPIPALPDAPATPAAYKEVSAWLRFVSPAHHRQFQCFRQGQSLGCRSDA